jgi:hypothetical protein
MALIARLVVEMVGHVAALHLGRPFAPGLVGEVRPRAPRLVPDAPVIRLEAGSSWSFLVTGGLQVPASAF